MDEKILLECPFCGATLPSRFRFCGECGRQLPAVADSPQTAGSPAADSASLSPTPLRPPERLQLTVMFADLVGSTALSMRLDPEEFRTVLRSYQTISAEAIERHGGHVAQYLGDGILAYFGYPTAHEDEAQRAVLAGLDVLKGMRVLHRRFKEQYGTDLAVRIAVHTGVVVVGEVGGGQHREPLALGGAPNVAARLQGLAGRNELVASEASVGLLGHRFEAEDLGVHELKGVDRPMRAYRIDGLASPGIDATEVGAPFVGRDRELERLRAAWAEAATGRGQVVLVSGEPGIGKTRLVGVLARSLRDTDHQILVWQCLPSFVASPLYPVVQSLQGLMGGVVEDAEGSAPDSPLVPLEELLARLGLDDDAITLPLASLLSIPVEGLDESSDTPRALRQKTEAAVSAVIERMARQRPLLLVVEDLHWADPSTVELVWRMVDEVRDWPALMALTSRPSFVPPWATVDRQRIDLKRMDRTEVETMLRALAQGRELTAEVSRLIVNKTAGIPLFVEELLRTLVDSGALVAEAGALRPSGPLPSLVIPQSLQDSLEARLDLLGVGKEVAQVGSVLGEAFSFGLLRAVWSGDEASLHEGLDALAAGRLIAVEGERPRARYAFEHALVHDVAYASLLRETRAHLHASAARALQEHVPDAARSTPELVAHHLLEAGDPRPAIPYLLRAAERAMRRSANREAITHLERGLGAVRGLPPSAARDAQELDLLMTLGTAWIHTQGYSSPESERTFLRARELSRVVGSGPGLFGALFGLFTYHFVREEPTEALALAEELHGLAEAAGDPGLGQAAHTSLAAVHLAMGRTGDARSHAEAALSLYEPDRDRALARSFGQDFGVTARSYLSWILWATGLPDSALREGERALATARDCDHPHTLALALSFADTLALLRGENERAAALSSELMQFAEEHGFPHWLADASVIHGSALVALGKAEEGVACLVRGREAYRAMGGELQLAFLAPVRVAALHAAGERTQAERELESTLERADAGARGWWWLGELYRLRGVLSLTAGGPAAAAETDFRRAVDECHRTGARTFGRRAATSLAELLAARGAHEEARRVLEECLREVTEGFDSPEAAAARALAGTLPELD